MDQRHHIVTKLVLANFPIIDSDRHEVTSEHRLRRSRLTNLAERATHGTGSCNMSMSAQWRTRHCYAKADGA